MKKPNSLTIFFTLSLLTNLTWIFSQQRSFTSAEKNVPPLTIPPEYASLDLTKCLPSKLEQEFFNKFPGQMETYQHANGYLILRQVKGATRKLHNTRTCLSASDFKLSTPELLLDEQERSWMVYTARNAHDHLTVKTLILDQSGRHWATVEEWFWDALFSHPTKTYLAISDIRFNDSL